MKKQYFMMAAAATMLAACSQTEMVNDVPEKAPKAIAFDNGFVNKSTRAENSSSNYTLRFSDHHSTFAVWGYKNIADEPVFDNKTVNVSLGEGAGSEIYTYEGLVYWDETADSYQFYAAAPADHSTWTFVEPTTDAKDDGYFTTSIELDNTKINNDQGAHMTAFKNPQDLLIAAPCKPVIGNTVAFEFIHILSRLNIVVSKKQGMAEEVRTFEVSVKNMMMEGSFDESTEVDDLAAGTTERWNAVDGSKESYTATKTEGAEVQAGVERHVIQTLVVPQTAAYEEIEINGENTSTATAPYLYVRYGVENGVDASGNNTYEIFEKYYNLADVFGVTEGNTLPFNEGWENTLTLTIGPASIDFKASVATWATDEDNEFSLD